MFLNGVMTSVFALAFLLLITMIAAPRRMGLRADDGPPSAMEILVPLVIWSVMFEIALPRMTDSPWFTADALDVAWYAIGAAVAAWIWRRRGASLAGGLVPPLSASGTLPRRADAAQQRGRGIYDRHRRDKPAG